MPFASRWDQPTGTFSPIAGSLPLLSPAGSTQRCCRFRLSWCNCFPGPSSWSLLPRHSVLCRCRSADRSGSLPPVTRIHEFPAFFPPTCVNVWGMCTVLCNTSQIMREELMDSLSMSTHTLVLNQDNHSLCLTNTQTIASSYHVCVFLVGKKEFHLLRELSGWWGRKTGQLSKCLQGRHCTQLGLRCHYNKKKSKSCVSRNRKQPVKWKILPAHTFFTRMEWPEPIHLSFKWWVR